MAKKPDIQIFSEVARTKGGIISAIARSFGVDRSTIYQWCKNQKYEKALDDSRETFLDTAETNLQTLVKGIPKVEKLEDGRMIQVGWEAAPSESAIIFTLRTLGRKRGYIEKQELDVDNKIRARILTNKEAKELFEDLEKEY